MAHDMSATELKTYEALYKNQDARIMFRCDNVTYQGIVSAIFPDTRRVKLRHVKTLEDDRYYGNLNFKFREISPFRVIESAEVVNRIPKNEYLLKILKNSRPVKSDVIVKALYGDKLPEESEDETPVEDTIEKNFVLDLPEHLEHKLPNNYVVIDIIDEDFQQAIDCISSQKLIAVSFHGPVISRFGKLNWICIATDIYSFLFDIHKLEKEAFDKGLKQVFENQGIKKVIHDSSYPSDCLAHCYATHLTNVFDTRVADYIVHMQRYNDKFEFHPFSSLDSCLRSYLQVPQDFLFKRETAESSSSVFQRPISNDSLYDLLKSVVYLKLLQEKLSKELLAPLYNATYFYRTVLAKSSQQLIDLLGNTLSKPDKMIDSVLMNGIQTVRFEEPQHKKIPLRCTFINPQTNEVIRPSSVPPAAMRNVPTSSDIRKECVVNEAHCQLVNSNSGKVIRPYLGSPAAVKSALLESIEKKKKLMAEKTTNKEATSSSAKSGFLNINKIYYHTSISEMYPGHLKNIENLKPMDHVSKFTDKQPLSSCFGASDPATSSSLNVSVENIDCNVDVSSEDSSNSNQESCDIWLKLREEFLADRNTASAHCKERKISFMPG